MSETGDLSDPEIQILCEEIVTFSVGWGRGRVSDFLQSLVYSETVFELTSIREVNRILVEECALEFLTELVVVSILSDSGVDIFGIRVVEGFSVSDFSKSVLRSDRWKSCGLHLFLLQIHDLLQFVIIQS